MTAVIFTIVVANVVLFTGLCVWGIRTARRDPLPRTRALSWAFAAVAAAFVLGALTRLALLAAAQGWLPGRIGEFLGSPWHLIQSLSATALGVGGVLLVRRLGPPLRRSERILTVLGERFGAARIADFGLTDRERQVLEVIGAGSISDKAIAEELFISPATAATHVKNILRKTGLASRRDLLLLVAAEAEAGDHRGIDR